MRQTPQAQRQPWEARLPVTDGLLLRLVNRRLSAPITFLLLKTSIAPTTVTWVALGTTALSACLVAQGQSLQVFWGGLLIQLAAVLDCVDGELARLKQATSRFGAWLDTLSDRLGLVAFFGASCVGLVRQGNEGPLTPWVPLGWTAFLLLVVSTALGYAASSLWRQRASPEEVERFHRFSHFLKNQSGPAGVLFRFLVFVSRREFLALLFMTLAVTNSLEGILWLTLAGGAIAIVSLMVIIWQLYRRAPDTAPSWRSVTV